MKALPLLFGGCLLLSCRNASSQQKPAKAKLDTAAKQIPADLPPLFLPKFDSTPVPKLHGQPVERLPGEDENKLIDYVFSDARPDEKAWNRHLRNHLRPCLDSAAKKGMPPGTYTVRVKLTIEKDGTIGGVEFVDSIGFGLNVCVVNAILSGPKWFPQLDKGKAVTTVQIQKVSFLIPEETEPL